MHADDSELYSETDVPFSPAAELSSPGFLSALLRKAEAGAVSRAPSPREAPPEPEEALARAIILQAVEDWRSAMDTLDLFPENREAGRLRRETEAFFRSRWFRILADLDGPTLLARLRTSRAGNCASGCPVPPADGFPEFISC